MDVTNVTNVTNKQKQSPGDNSSVLGNQGLHGFFVSVVRIGPLAHLDMCFLALFHH